MANRETSQGCSRREVAKKKMKSEIQTHVRRRRTSLLVHICEGKGKPMCDTDVFPIRKMCTGSVKEERS